MDRKWISTHSGRVSALLSVCFLYLSGCATAPPPTTFYKTAQTQLSLDSEPSGKVYLDHKYVGVTPIAFPLGYEQQVEQDTQKVTYWETQPGLSLFLTIVSLGLYLPFSFIPVDSKSTTVALDSYRNNHFRLLVEAPGYSEWNQDVIANGEQNLSLRAQLVKAQP
jgi:hypothetical protein